MSVDIAPHSEGPIPFMQQNVTHQILNDSCNIYNSLLPETSLSIDQKDEEHAAQLIDIIRKGGAWDKITVLVLHCHKQLRPNHSWVGSIKRTDESDVYLTKHVANEEIALDMTSGHKFQYIKGKGFCAFTFVQGEPPVDFSGMNEEVFPRLEEYLTAKGLTSRFGFGVRIPKLASHRWTEYQLPDGMVLVKTQWVSADDQATTVITEWWCDTEETFGVGVNCQSSPTGQGHIKPPPKEAS
ncbi:uncharacterized protein FFNC_15583 [Fusarium fujikuroi]|nr:uncharacterized protein FFNC_15583 [Fusarium fujikuroi]